MAKNILITGGAGYIGSHIAEILVKNKYKKKKIKKNDQIEIVQFIGGGWLEKRRL